MNPNLSKLKDDAIYELRMIRIERGETLTTEEYNQVLQRIAKDCLIKKKFIRGARLRMFNLQLLTTIGTIRRKNFKETRHGTKTIRRGAKETSKNFKEVLKGVSITSDCLTLENMKNVVMQHEAAKKYHYDYVSYMSDFCSKVMYPQEINSFLESEGYTDSMKKSRQKVLSFSKKYQTKTS